MYLSSSLRYLSQTNISLDSQIVSIYLFLMYAIEDYLIDAPFRGPYLLEINRRS